MRTRSRLLSSLGSIVILVLVLVVASAATGGSAKRARQSAGGQPVTTSVWVSPSGNNATCARGNAAKPCGSLLRAYQVAECGDLVSVEAGNYPEQLLGHSDSGQNTDAKDCSAENDPVVFRGESQRGVTFGGVTVGEPWLTLANVTTAGLAIQGWDSSVGCYANPVIHVTVSGAIVDARGTQSNPLWMGNVQYVTLVGNSIGNVVTGESEIGNPGAAPCPHNAHLSFTGNTWHDFLNPNGAADHMECLQFDALPPGTSNDDVTLRNNRFLNCGQYDLFVSGPMNGWRIQNNFFDTPCSGQGGTGCVVAGGALSLSNEYANVTGEFNVFAPDTYPQFSILEGGQSGGVWQYNINGSFPETFHCGAQNHWTLTGNVDAGAAVCGTDSNALGRPRLVVLTSTYDGHSLWASYGIVADTSLQVRLTVYSGKRMLDVRTPTRALGIYDSPATFHWRNSSTSRPTRLCARALDASGATVAVSCANVES